MLEAALFSGRIYTVDKNFTRPPVATVATNSKSVSDMFRLMGEQKNIATCNTGQELSETLLFVYYDKLYFNICN